MSVFPAVDLLSESGSEASLFCFAFDANSDWFSLVDFNSTWLIWKFHFYLRGSSACRTKREGEIQAKRNCETEGKSLPKTKGTTKGKSQRKKDGKFKGQAFQDAKTRRRRTRRRRTSKETRSAKETIYASPCSCCRSPSWRPPLTLQASKWLNRPQSYLQSWQVQILRTRTRWAACTTTSGPSSMEWSATTGKSLRWGWALLVLVCSWEGSC